MTLTINDQDYETNLELEWTTSVDRTEIRARFPGSDVFFQKQVNCCEHCGRGDWQEMVCTSVEEAVRRGWLRPVGETGSDE